MEIVPILSPMVKQERGSILIVTLMMLSILTLLGMAATQSSIFEISLSTAEKLYNEAFNSAETGLAVVIANSDILGDGNVDTAASQNLTVGNFSAVVQYQGASSGASLRGSGYSAGKFRAHNYRITSTGIAARETQTQVMAEGYRVGF